MKCSQKPSRLHILCRFCGMIYKKSCENKNLTGKGRICLRRFGWDNKRDSLEDSCLSIQSRWGHKRSRLSLRCIEMSCRCRLGKIRTCFVYMMCMNKSFDRLGNALDMDRMRISCRSNRSLMSICRILVIVKRLACIFGMHL